MIYDKIMRWISSFILQAPFMCIIFAVVGLYSCRSTKYVPLESQKDSIIVEKLVEVQLPPDSATIRALLECDENGRVVLNWLDIANSKNAQAMLTIDSLGNLLAKMRTQPDTVYLPSKEVVVSKTENIPYPVEKELTRWQQFLLDVGGWAIGIICIGILVFVIRFIIVKRLN